MQSYFVASQVSRKSAFQSTLAARSIFARTRHTARLRFQVKKTAGHTYRPID
jgi:hypothetical protein